VEFVIQDTYAALRPQWKLLLNDLQAAGELFSEACKQNYHDTASSKNLEPEEPETRDEDLEDSDGDDAEGEAERPLMDGGPTDVKSDPDETLDDAAEQAANSSSDESEHIVVTRPEEQRDPEAEAEFDRELAKLMAESVESRKFERKPMFDVPLPMRRAVREPTAAVSPEDSDDESLVPAPAPTNAPGMMKFALLSRRGNRQQVHLFVIVQFCVKQR
jgi:regulator of nonsense transcripts 2